MISPEFLYHFVCESSARKLGSDVRRIALLLCNDQTVIAHSRHERLPISAYPVDGRNLSLTLSLSIENTRRRFRHFLHHDPHLRM